MVFIRYLLICITIFGLAAQSIGQRDYIEEADDAFSNRQYQKAIQNYKQALERINVDKTERNRITFQLTECYRITNDMKDAEPVYLKLIKSKYSETSPIVILYYADALRENGKYNEALIQYQNYQNKVPNDKRAENGIKSCSLATDWLKNPTIYQVTNEKTINTSYDDYAPSFADQTYSTLIFTSSNPLSTGKELDEWTNQRFSDLFITSRTKAGKWSSPRLLEDKKLINTDANEGTPSIDASFHSLYFTRCPNEKNVNHSCRIFYSELHDAGWTSPKLIPLCTDSVSNVGHPSISSDGLTLYFASNMPSGIGGKDIWVASRTGKDQPFGTPQNLGSVINSQGDEMFPFIRSDSILYFASDGYPGIGGLDIFKSIQRNGEWTPPENLKSPVNSSKDDFAIIFFPNEEKGYFTSNRNKGSGSDDIYYFIRPVFYYAIHGTVRDQITRQPVTDATITLSMDGSKVLEQAIKADGSFALDQTQIAPEHNYKLTISRTNYFNDEFQFSTFGKLEKNDFIYNVDLKPIPEKPIVLPEILYDLGEWQLKPRYQDSLADLIKTLKANPDIVIEVASHTDSRPISISNDTLSLKRAQSVANYLISKGIRANQLIPRGYGDKVPRKLDKDIIRDGYLFKAGTVLTDSWINSLTDSRQKEAAYQLNRRTEIRVAQKEIEPVAATINKKPETTKPITMSPKTDTLKPAKVKQEAITYYTVQLAAGSNIQQTYFQKIKNNEVIKCTGKDGITRYFVGKFQTQEEATTFKIQMRSLGYKDAFTVKENENTKGCFTK